MNAGRDVERLIADWFVEEAVLRAPDRVLTDAGRAIDRTKQRRLHAAGRTIQMPVSPRLATAAVLGVLVVGGALLAMRPSLVSVATSPSPLVSPTAPSSPTPQPTASPPVASDAFVIPAMTERTTPGPDGISIGYPTGWVVEEDGVRWWLNGEPDSQLLIGFYVDSSKLEVSETADEWVADSAAEESEGISMTCPAPGPTEIMIGSEGRRGIVLSSDCRYGGMGHHFRAVLVEGDRGYSFHMDTTRGNGRAWFEALLANVTFEEAASEDP
jgi:hypothetical protein